jgi:nucleotidyltransferase substrate binding protein (TIGR01987 family)
VSTFNEAPFSSKDLQIFGQCLSRLEEMLLRATREPDDEAVRESVIKRFELTYELAFSTLLKYLNLIEASSDKVLGYDFQNVIPKGDQYHLLRTGWPEWKAYRANRNRTVDMYREDVAKEVAAGARDFANEARVLFENLSKRLTQDA